MAIVTLSRGTYSGARTVAEELAKRLGYPCVGQEAIFAAARAFGVPEAELSATLHQAPAHPATDARQEDRHPQCHPGRAP